VLERGVEAIDDPETVTIADLTETACAVLNERIATMAEDGNGTLDWALLPDETKVATLAPPVEIALPPLESHVQVHVDAPLIPAPIVSVEQPLVIVDAPDMRPIADALASLREQLRPRDRRVIRDEQGRITGLEEVDDGADAEAQ